jgi:hypothetical protein
VVSRRIDLLVDDSDLVHAVLPHEISHILFASELGTVTPPLWADEGIAVLSETDSAKHAHERNLDNSFESGTWFSAEQLMTMKGYPANEHRDLFYAASVSLVEFLVSHGGSQRFLEFVRSASASGYEAALRRAFGISSYNQLDMLWSQHIRMGIAARTAAGQSPGSDAVVGGDRVRDSDRERAKSPTIAASLAK